MLFELVTAATFGEVMKYIGFVIVALLGLMLMIIIHELGHYLAGKALKFKIDEFGIGFGPPIFKRVSKKTGEVFTIRPIPLGGFCAFHGEDEDKDDPQAFNNQKPWKRLIVLFSGAFFNFLSAIFIITLFFSIYGQVLPVVYDVHEGSKADIENTFQKGDVILQVNGKMVHIILQEDAVNLFDIEGDSAEFKVLRRTFDDNGKVIKSETVKFTATKGDFYYDVYDVDEEGNIVVVEEDVLGYGFGIQRVVAQVKLGFFRALGRAFPFCFLIVFKILASLGALITGKLALSSAGGTITVIKTIAEVSSQGGFSNFMYILCILSANLAVMNLLPFPALDGSRMVFCLIEWIFKKPVPRKVEAAIHAVGFILLIVLVVFLDVFNLVSNR